MHEELPRVCPVCGSDHASVLDRVRNTRLSVLMPVYNERHSVREIVARVQSVKIPKEIIIVDDGSTDGTADIVDDLEAASRDRTAFGGRVRLFRHGRNLGKGAAISTAVGAAHGDIMVIQDADLEYDPMEYFHLLDPILRGRADVVYGSRFMGGSPHRVLYFWHAMGNRVLTLFSNMFTNLNLTDIETGYKAFRADVLKSIELKQQGFGVEVEITSKVARMQCRIYEVGIGYAGRTYKEGKKITWRDGLKAVFLVLKYR